MYILISVSYTHLDVYKRQGIGECVCGCTEQSQDRTGKDESGQHQDNRGQREHRKGRI